MRPYEKEFAMKISPKTAKNAAKITLSIVGAVVLGLVYKTEQMLDDKIDAYFEEDEDQSEDENTES